MPQPRFVTLLYWLFAPLSQFKMVSLTHVSRYFNQEADEIAQRASGFKKIERKEIDQKVLRKFLPSLEERGLMVKRREKVTKEWNGGSVFFQLSSRTPGNTVSS